MKNKFMLLPLTVLLASSSSFAASTGIVNFNGSVTDTTCDLVVLNNDGTQANDIDLGVVSATTLTGAAAKSEDVNFTLRPATGAAQACTDGSKTLELTFTGPWDSSNNLANENGTARGVSVKLEGMTNGSNWQTFSANHQTVDQMDLAANTGAISLRAHMVPTGGGAAVTAGSVTSHATFSAVYK